MPKVGKSYAMNPAVARRKAADDGDADDITPTNASNDQDSDDLIPPGQELESARIEPAENGYTVTHHTRTKPGTKPKGGKGEAMPMSDYRGKSRVFESKGGAAGHLMKVLSAHEASKRKK